MSTTEAPSVVQALIEAGRRYHLIDPAGGERLAAEARNTGVSSIAALKELLEHQVIPGVALGHRLARLLARPDDRIDGYQLMARLPGKVGISWLAEDDEGRLVLVRQLAGQAFDPQGDEAGRRRFLREAGVCQQLDHPNLVRFLQAGTTGAGEPWFSMEYLPAGDLALTLRVRGGRLDIALALHIGVQVAAGLGELHRLGLMHRAVSPQSIFVDGSGVTKLGEFGLARDESGPMTMMTTTQASDSSPLWMAPEVAMGEGSLGIVSDIYSLGCVLFACVAGRPPFVGEGPDLLHAHVSASVPDLSVIAPGTDRETAAAIAACLAKNPDDRPDPAQLQAMLQHARQQLPREQKPAVSSSCFHRRRTDSGRLATTTTRRALSLTGNLADMHLGDLLQTLQRMEATGGLQLDDGQRRRLIAIDSGAPIGIGIEHRQDVAELVERLGDDREADPGALRQLAAEVAPPGFVAGVQETGAASPDALRAGLQGQLFDQLCARFWGSDDAFAFIGAETGDETVDALLAEYRQLGLRLNPDHLLMEAARQHDEWRTLRGRLPATWCHPRIDPADRDQLDREFPYYPERCLLRSMDGSTPLGRLHLQAGCTPHAAARFTADLLERALLDWVPAAGLAQAAGANQDEAERWELGRASLAMRADQPTMRRLLGSCLAEAVLPDDEVAVATLTPVPVQGDLADAMQDDWLALVSDADGQGTAVHCFAGSEVIFGKLAKEPVQIALRKYPEAAFRAESSQISRVHGNLRYLAEREVMAITDLGSGNGTVLDGNQLVAHMTTPLPGDRESMAVIAGILHLRLRPIWPGRLAVPELSGSASSDQPSLAGLAIQRPDNRPELAYALVRSCITIGGENADVVLPEIAGFEALAIARDEGRWLWAVPGSDAVWHPLRNGEELTLGHLRLQAQPGEHRLFH